MATAPADVDATRQVIVAAAAQRAAASALSSASVTQAIAGFHEWYDDAAVKAWAALVTARVETLQRYQASLTDAYLARVASLLTGRNVPGVGAVDVQDLRTGVKHQVAYERVAVQYRYQRSIGRDDARARELATLRGVLTADIDEQLAVRAQSEKFMTGRADTGVTGWRRVIHPELSKGGVCGLCVAASHRRYGPTEPLPIHGRCKCQTVPIIGGKDPGSVINDDDLTAAYRAAGTTGADELKRVRFVVHQHGELGPVLRLAGDDFRDASDVAA